MDETDLAISDEITVDPGFVLVVLVLLNLFTAVIGIGAGFLLAWLVGA